jgi:solute carrier family 50 protein (sugar transporter)
VVYGYYTRDPFVVAANLPGFVLSIWLNSGASKLQYLALTEDRRQRLLRHQARQEWDASRPMEEADDEVLLNDTERNEMEDAFVMVPQEKALLRILTVWAVVIVYVGWFSRIDPASIIGVVVNINLIVFYGAPLQTMHTVIATKNSESIHVPTMAMNWLNTFFWIGYGIARHDAVIIVPNVLGLCLGLMQGALKAMYPSRPGGDLQPVPDDDESNSTQPPEEELPVENVTDISLNRRRSNE